MVTVKAREIQKFHKAKVIQAFSQPNPDRDEFLNFPGQQSPNQNFGQANFRLGAQVKSNRDLKFSQNCFGVNHSVFNTPTFNSTNFCFGLSTQVERS